MDSFQRQQVDAAKQAALEVLLHNAHGPFAGLPRTAGWGYPEPYTRDLMLSILGIAVSDEPKLLAIMRKVLQTLAKNQTERGHIPSLVHEKEDRGSSDTTPLFLLAVGIYRHVTGQPAFLQPAVRKALT
ncbi:MAG: glycoside hydrolase 100 family protein, partial [Anaerolineales bacterium]